MGPGTSTSTAASSVYKEEAREKTFALQSTPSPAAPPLFQFPTPPLHLQFGKLKEDDEATGLALGDHPRAGRRLHRHGRQEENGHPSKSEAAAAAPPGGGGGRLVVVVRRVQGQLGSGRVVPAVRRGELPLRPQGVRLPPHGPP